ARFRAFRTVTSADFSAQLWDASAGDPVAVGGTVRLLESDGETMLAIPGNAPIDFGPEGFNWAMNGMRVAGDRMTLEFSSPGLLTRTVTIPASNAAATFSGDVFTSSAGIAGSVTRRDTGAPVAGLDVWLSMQLPAGQEAPYAFAGGVDFVAPA